MISITRLIRLGVRVATWATPHVKDWHRKRHVNVTEGKRHLEARNWSEAEKHLTLALGERSRPAKQRIELMLSIETAQRHQHKLAEAEQTARQAIELATKDGDRSARALAMEAMVDVQLEQSKYTDAEQTIKEIQQMEESRSSPDHERLARCSRKLGSAYLKSGRQAEAMEAFKRAADLSEQVFGPDHVETANTLAELAAMHGQHGDQVEAQRCIRRALEIHRARLGANSQEASNDLNVLATSLQESGDFEAAMGEYERVLATRERQIGSNREQTAEIQVRLAALYLHKDRYSAARELLIHAVGVLERSGGARLGFALEALASAEECSGRTAEAQRWRDKAVKLGVQRVPAPAEEPAAIPVEEQPAIPSAAS